MQTYGKHDNNQQVLWFVAFCGAANIPKSSRLPFHGWGFSGSGFRLRICPSFWIRPNIRTTPLPSNPPKSESQELHSALLVLRPQPFEPYSPNLCPASLSPIESSTPSPPSNRDSRIPCIEEYQYKDALIVEARFLNSGSFLGDL